MTIGLIEGSIMGARLNLGAERVVLYVDEFGLRRCADGIERYLPVLVPEGQAGFVEFLEQYQDRIAEYFGDDFEEAEARVDQINQREGISRDEAMKIVEHSMELQNQQLGAGE